MQSPFTPNSGVAANLINDGHQFTAITGGDKRTFTANVANGWVMVTVTIGSNVQALDGLRISDGDTGRVLADNLSSPLGVWNHATFPALVTDGTLNLQFEDMTGPNRRVSLAGLEIRPLDLNSMGFPVADSLDADGTTIDTFTIYNAPANSLVTIDASRGTLIGTDAEPAIVGFQVATNAAGQGTFQLQRPFGSGEGDVDLSSPLGEKLGCVVINYAQPSSLLFDFNTNTSATQAGYVGVKTTDLYSANATHGWLSQPDNFAMLTPLSGTAASLVNDGHRGSTANTFRTDLANGSYVVHLRMGDNADHVGVSVTANGQPVLLKQALSRNSIFETSFPVTISNGRLDLTFSSNDASFNDPHWVINAIEIRPTNSLGTVTPTNVGKLAADGSTITTINATSSLSKGSLVTVSTTLGTITSPDADPQTAGTQVVVGNGGAISFNLRSPVSPGTPTVEWRSTDGSTELSLSNATFLSFGNAASRFFDFNRGFSDATMSATATGYIGVRTNHNPATDGFGWTTAPTAFTSPSDPPSVTPLALYQDGHMGAPGVTGEFRFSATSGASYDLVAYVGRYGTSFDQIRVTAEGAAPRIASATNWNQFTTVAITGATDVNHDGFISVTFEDATTKNEALQAGLLTGWAVVGLDVLEDASPLQAVIEMTPSSTNSSPEMLTTEQAETHLALAKTFIAATTPLLSAADRAALNAVTIRIVDLNGTGLLAMTSGNQIYLDDNGAGLGWSLATEAASTDETDAADDPAVTPTEYDLLTVLAHELGHVLGKDHTDSGLMSPTLTPGLRAQAIDNFFATFQG